MKYLFLAISALLLFTLAAFGEQLTPGEQAHASVAAHRREANNNGERRHHRRHRRHHHRRHGAA